MSGLGGQDLKAVVVFGLNNVKNCMFSTLDDP